MIGSAAFSAPGKLMLFGEFAVLEGYPALALCFDKRIRCEATAGGGALRFEAPQLLDQPIVLPVPLPEVAPPALALLWPLIVEAAPALGGLSLVFDAEFPSTWGLGSSSASSLAAVAAVRALLRQSPDAHALFGEVRALQRALQGNASGYDAATQLLGGVVRFQDPGLAGGDGSATLQRLDVPARHWLVGYTGRKAKTGPMVRSVRQRHPRGSEIYAQIGDLAVRAVGALAGPDAALGALLNEGHGLLDALGAVPGDLRAPMAQLQAHSSVLGARMCGAGGGDCVLVLASDGGATQALADVGFSVLPLSFTDIGLRAEPLQPREGS